MINKNSVILPFRGQSQELYNANYILPFCLIAWEKDTNFIIIGDGINPYRQRFEYDISGDQSLIQEWNKRIKNEMG